MSKKAMKLALEALRELIGIERTSVDIELGEKAITALREALVEPDFWEGYVPEPTVKQSLTVEQPAPVQQQSCYCPNCEVMSKELAELKKQEPVAWLDGPHLIMRVDWRDRANYKGPWVDLGRAIPDSWAPILYTSPPAKRTWVGLTDEEISETALNNPPMVHELARAIEAKLKEKNT